MSLLALTRKVPVPLLLPVLPVLPNKVNLSDTVVILVEFSVRDLKVLKSLKTGKPLCNRKVDLADRMATSSQWKTYHSTLEQKLTPLCSSVLSPTPSTFFLSKYKPF